jgi:hypothetical protein
VENRLQTLLFQMQLVPLHLGERLLRAFNTKTGMPYAWVNLKSGVREGEVTAGVGWHLSPRLLAV